jgi:hypothetical protein
VTRVPFLPQRFANERRNLRTPSGLNCYTLFGEDKGVRTLFGQAMVCRYVERNALRADLVDRAEDWRWGPLLRWLAKPEPNPKLLSAWPIPRLPGWKDRVNKPLTEKELKAVRWSGKRGSPYGNETWVESIARRLDLESTHRPRGRPKRKNRSSQNASNRTRKES